MNRRTELLLFVGLCTLLSAAGAQEPATPAEPKPERVYRIGFAPADVDTPVEKYLKTVNGIDTQCAALTRIMETVCCDQYGLGCNVRYVCEVVEIGSEILMTDTAYSYQWETGYVGYPVNHGSVVGDVMNHLEELRLYSRHLRMLIVGTTRHRILVDDESTKVTQHKVNPGDLRFQFLGMLVPGKTPRDGRLMILNYYAAQAGILLSLAPSLDTSLAQALAEYRSSIFSFDQKVFTGTGTRDLFELGEGGRLVPNATGCYALAEREPPHLTRLLGEDGPADP